MKRTNTLWSLVLALVMVLGVFAPLGALAAKPAEKKDQITVNVHKVLMSKKIFDEHNMDKKYDPTKAMSEDDLQKFFFEKKGETGYENEFVKQIDGVYFVAIKEDEAHYDDFDKLSASDQKTAVDKMDEGRKGLTANGGVVAFKLDNNANYKIYEVKSLSTYKGDDKELLAEQKAVPIELKLPEHAKTATGVASEIHVYPKNTQNRPEIDKNFKEGNKLDAVKDDKNNINVGADYKKYQEEKARAKAEVGKEIPYEVKTKIDAGTSYERLIWNDIMTNGLTYNKDLELTSKEVTLEKGTDYKIVEDDNGFRLEMTEAGLKEIKKVTTGDEAKAVELKLTYSATVNGTAVVDEPEKNNVTLEYGHKKGKDFEKKTVTPKDCNLKVTKKFGDGAKLDKLKIVYTLEKDGEVKASVALDKTIVNKTIDLGNGIKFVVGAEPFNGEFQGLVGDAKGWTISERVAGYNPEYAEQNAAGEVTITNNKDNDNPTLLEPTTPEVVVGGKKFVKIAEGTTDRLAGAKFVVKNLDGKYLAAKSVDKVEAEKTKLEAAKTALNTAVKNYNKRENDNDKDALEKKINEAQKTYNEAFKTAGIRYDWVADKDAAGVVELSSNSKGQFMIEGLEYGKYKLEEIEAPKGYAKINDQEFTVAEGNADDVKIKYAAESEELDAYRVINKKVTIPQTGGIGTMIFMVAGLALMGGAFIAMKKRSAEQA